VRNIICRVTSKIQEKRFNCIGHLIEWFGFSSVAVPLIQRKLHITGCRKVTRRLNTTNISLLRSLNRGVVTHRDVMPGQQLGRYRDFSKSKWK